jgi:O-antigen ligase
VALLALLSIVVATPFERPFLDLPGGFTLTTVEAVLMFALVVIAANLGPRRLGQEPIPLLVPGTALLGLLALAAVVAPADRANAIKFVGRMGIAAALFLATLRVVDTGARARIVVRVMLATATLVAVIAILEAAQLPAVMQALTAFRPGFHVVGGQLRATSTLFYPTIASMYLEVAFALGAWLLIDPSARRPRLERALVFTALTIVGAGITATFTRAGLFGMAATLIIVAALGVRRTGDLGVLGALGSALVAIVVFSHTPELLATRLTTEGSQAWYGARYEVPSTLELGTGQHHRVPITITNTGRMTWDSGRAPAIAMSYHWLRAGNEEVVQFDGARTSFPAIVAPGRTVTMEASVVSPGQPGEYTLVWDAVHESRAWFSTEGVTPARTHVVVSGPPLGAVATTMPRLPSASVIPSRRALWSAAFQIAKERPWLGIGPDNFRQVYGRYLGIANWDRRVHANNMYLDVLAGAGVGAALALMWLVAAAGWALWGRVRDAGVARAATVAALAVWVVIAGHGLVDSFLSFTTTYVTFAIAAGLALSSGIIATLSGTHEPRNPGTSYAHRV